MRLSPPYSAYARIYDKIGQRSFGERMASVILQELSNLGLSPRSVLDLGCGTGSATLEFARAGLSATGLDRSAAMLAQAQDLAIGFGLNIDWIEGDMTELPVTGPFELITCIYDALNYLQNDGEVRDLFDAVYQRLAPGGVFAFDMNTRHRLNSSWEQGLILAGDSDDLYVTYRSWFDVAIDASPLVITAFVRQPDESWLRFDEEHVERAWPIVDICRWLTESGFHLRQVDGYIDATGDSIRPASEDHGRVLFIASR